MGKHGTIKKSRIMKQHQIIKFLNYEIRSNYQIILIFKATKNL